MRIYKTKPDLKNERQMALWHKALRSQWTAEDLSWGKPVTLTGHARDVLGRILTPILTGEQAALYSVSNLIPIFGSRSEVEAQFYLTTWAVDEARHTELFCKFYDRIERDPLPIRRFPSGYLFQSAIISKEPAEWLAGVLVSECLAAISMEEFRRVDVDPVLSEISDGILRDEARHLAFNRLYLDERIRQVIGLAGDPKDLLDLIQARRDQVLEKAKPIFRDLASELREMGVDWEGIVDQLGARTQRHLDLVARAAVGRFSGIDDDVVLEDQIA